MKFILILFIGILTLTLNAQTDGEETVIFSRIGELGDEQLNNSGASKLTFVTDEKEVRDDVIGFKEWKRNYKRKN